MKNLYVVAAFVVMATAWMSARAQAQGHARKPPAPRRASLATLPDEAVVKAIDAGQHAFLRCWVRAQRTEAKPIASKVRLHLELDEQGAVTVVDCDAASAALTRCLSLVARRLPFPAPGRAMSVDLPLMFQ